jgi:hypothetical protein
MLREEALALRKAARGSMKEESPYPIRLSNIVVS